MIDQTQMPVHSGRTPARDHGDATRGTFVSERIVIAPDRSVRLFGGGALTWSPARVQLSELFFSRERSTMARKILETPRGVHS